MGYDLSLLTGCASSSEIDDSEDAQQGPLTKPIRSPRLRELADRVGTVLAGRSPLGVAFSGGVDSTLLLALAARQLGREKVIAIVGVSPSLAHRDRKQARALAADLGVRCIDVRTREDELLAYRRNNRDRCYFCKDELFRKIESDVVEEYGLVAVAYGETAEDVSRGNRPGARAAKEHGVLRPLADAGFIKIDVRELAYSLGLPNWNKPAAPCLATRIPHSMEVTPEKLRQVEAAEAALHRLGFDDLRVRHHGDIARIEVPVTLLHRVVVDPLRSLIVDAATVAGFRFVTVDLCGLRPGHLSVITSNDV